MVTGEGIPCDVVFVVIPCGKFATYDRHLVELSFEYIVLGYTFEYPLKLGSNENLELIVLGFKLKLL